MQQNIPPSQWQHVAWNGIEFSMPSSWEVGAIGKRYLMLEDGMDPVMEIKWQSGNQPDALQTVFNRIVKQQKKMSGRSIRRWSLPVSWKNAVDPYQVVGFDWHHLSSAGCGVILFCAECRQTTVIQFYRRSSIDDESICTQVLSSIRDHSRGDRVWWSIYHARFRMPSEFQLEHYRFEPGLLRMDFTHSKQRLSVCRWGPASVILSRRTLSDFAEKYFNFSDIQLHDFQVNASGDRGFEWKIEASARFRPRLFSNTGYTWGRIWHLQRQNRIMAVHAAGRRPFDAGCLIRICDGYESI